MRTNRDKHIWEGWTVGDFIDEIEILFNMHEGFESKEQLRNWVKDMQPYYKKHIPEVYRHFLNRTTL